MEGAPGPPVQIGPPRSTSTPDPTTVPGPATTYRVTASVDGTDVWFERDGAALRPSHEAFASAFLLPAQLVGRPLSTEGALDPVWLAGARTAGLVAQRWWGAPPLPVDAPVRATTRPGRRRRWLPRPRQEGRPPSGHRERSRLLCFTGGVDSFHTLLTHPDRPLGLVFAVGYDVALDDTTRATAAIEGLGQVASATGCEAVVVRTNLRDHPLHRATGWEQVHGGALAALGLLLADEWGGLLVSSSFSADQDRPWGSHWELDPCWSTSEVVVTHVGHGCDREGKVATIARSPMALAHLRVCWAHLSDDLNCGRCDKCLETMVMLHAEGVVDRSTTFGPWTAATLAERLSDLPTTSYRRAYGRLLARGLDEPIRTAAADLLARSEPAEHT